MMHGFENLVMCSAYYLAEMRRANIDRLRMSGVDYAQQVMENRKAPMCHVEETIIQGFCDDFQEQYRLSNRNTELYDAFENRGLAAVYEISWYLVNTLFANGVPDPNRRLYYHAYDLESGLLLLEYVNDNVL